MSSPAPLRPGPARAALFERAARLRPLPALSGTAYARGHARFEQLSDQRGQIVGWLRRLVAPRATAPVRVLSIGAGDGTVDAEVARTLAAGGSPVRYDAVEPHPASAAAWLERVRTVHGVRADVQVAPLERAQLAGHYDLVVAVHSLYYVGPLAPALRRAAGLLAPGGQLVVLHAPREPLNALADVLTAVPQPWSEQVAEALAEAGADVEPSRLSARLDLTDADDEVLDFTVQCALPAQLREPLRAALAEIRLPGPGLVVPHPIDAFVVMANGSRPASSLRFHDIG